MLQLCNRLRLAYHRRRSPYWFVSFPKSGRTWTKSIVETYICRLYDLPPFTFEEFTPWIRPGLWRQVPRLTFAHPHCRDVHGKQTAVFMRKLMRKKVIVLVRDPRKVVYTYYFRLRKREKDPKALSLSLAEFVRDEEFGISRVIDFTNTWYNSGSKFRKFLCLRFEDIQGNPIQQISRILTFLDIPVENDLLSQVINETLDLTTQKIEDPTFTLADADKLFIDSAMMDINPAIGYQAGAK